MHDCLLWWVLVVFLVCSSCGQDSGQPCVGDSERKDGFCKYIYGGVHSWGYQDSGEFGSNNNTKPSMINVTFDAANIFVDASIHALINSDGDVFARFNITFQKISAPVKMKSIIRDSISEEPLLLGLDSRVYRLYKNNTIDMMPFQTTAPNISHASYDLFVANRTQVFSYSINAKGEIEYKLHYTANDTVTKTISNSISRHKGLILANGLLLMWGENLDFQLGDETKKKSSTPVIANVPEPVVQASLGEQFTIALCKNGSVYFWGSMYDALSESSPTRLYIPGVPKIAKVSAGRHHAMLVDPDGWSYAVGSNRVGQLGDFTFISRKTPVFSTDIRDMKATVQIYHSGDSSITVFNGSAILWYTEEGVPDTSNFTAMDMSNIDSPVQRIIGGDEFTMLLTEKGTVFGTGANNFGNLGDGTKSESLVPVPLTMSGILYKKTINELFTAQRDLSSAVFAIASDNKLYGWGANALISCKDSNYLSLTPDVIELPNNYAVKQIAPAFGLVLLEDGNIYKCSGNHMSIYTNSKIPFSNETFESVHTFPDSAGLAAFTKKNNVVIVSSSKVIKSLSPMMMNYSSVEGDITVGVLKRDIKIDGELFDVASVDSMTLWKVDNAPRLIVVTKSGDTFISSSGTWKRFLETPVDIKRSTTSVLVFSNNTMLVYWALKDSPVIRSIPFPTSSTLAKLIAVERTSYGVSVIVWSCSKHFTGENCTTPICYGKSSNDRSVCSGNGKCTKPATCECQPLYKGENCQQLSALAFVLIALGGTAIAVVSLLVIILVLVYILNKAFIGIRSIIKQRRTEIEMNALLQESLLKDDVELTDWVIPLSEITLLEKISEGSFGLVFKGRYKNSDVAVKVIKNDTGEDNMMGYDHEVKILRSLRHPNIVLFMGVSVNEENRFIITELMLGKSLHDLIHGRQSKRRIEQNYLHNAVSFEKKVELLLDVVKGMMYLHGLDPVIVHRDLKPNNILLDKTYQISKVCDFGTARFMGANNGTMTGNVGTILYMAPEILKNKLDKDQSTKLDVYSFGIIMFEVFFEEVPYRNNDEKFESVIALGTQIASGLRPNIPKNLVQDVSDAEKMFLTLMEACWDQNPSIRPSFEEIFSVFMEIGVLTKK